MTRGYKNCNPGNIRSSSVRYLGEVVPSKDTSFKQFESMKWGYRAIFVLLRTYQVRHDLNTLREMIERYAPPTENDTTNYVNFVSTRTRIADIQNVDTLKLRHMIPIVAAISRMENGVEPDILDVIDGWELFINDYIVK